MNRAGASPFAPPSAAAPGPPAQGTGRDGARPDQANDEPLAAQQVREMFSRIAPRYDFLNHLLSFSLDRIWRRRAAKRLRSVLARVNSRALDVCCGTGDLALALWSESGGEVYACDFARPMLLRARQKTIARHARASFRSGAAAAGHASAVKLVSYVEADALALPFPDTSLDVVALAFGFRNLANYDRGLREFFRVLRPGGQLGILEFSEPRSAVFGNLYRWYFTRWIPRIGRLISGHRTAYEYLPSSVAQFPSPEQLTLRLHAAGFADARYELWTGGIVAFHRATRA